MKTVKELAKELGVSDQTIRNEIKRQKIIVSKDKCAYVVTDADAKQIKKGIDDRREGATEAKVKKTYENVRDLTFAFEKEIEDKDRQIEFLKGEIAMLHEQILTLNNTLADVTASLKAIQAMQTGRKLIEQQEAPSRRWWQFWKP